MINIIKMRVLHFRRNYQVFIIMTAITLFFVFIFNLSGGSNTIKLGWIEELSDQKATFLYNKLKENPDITLNLVTKLQGEEMMADMKLDYLMAVTLNPDQTVQIDLYSMVEDMSRVERRNRLESGLQQYLTDLKRAEDIDKNLHVLVPAATYGDSALWLDMLQKNFQNKKTISLKLERIGSSVWQNYDNKLHNLMGFGLMFSMFALIFSISDVLTDMKNHSWARLNIAPMKTLTILIGYFTPSVFLGFFQLSLLFFFGIVFFQIDFGQHIPAVFLFLFLFALTVACLGVLLASVLKTRGQVGAVSAVVINGTSMLGGCMWPLIIVNSKIMIFLSYLVPQRWALEAIEGLTMYNQAPKTYWLNAIVLLCMSLLFLGAGLFLFVRSKDKRIAGA